MAVSYDRQSNDDVIISWVFPHDHAAFAIRVVYSADDEDIRHTSRTLEPNVRSYTLDLNADKGYSVCVEVLFNSTSTVDIWETNLERSCVDVTAADDDASSEDDDVNQAILYIALPTALASFTTIIILVICFTVVFQRKKAASSQHAEENGSSINAGLLAGAAVSSPSLDDVDSTLKPPPDTATASTSTEDSIVRAKHRKQSQDSLEDVLDSQRSSMVDRSSISIMTMPPSMRAAALSALSERR